MYIPQSIYIVRVDFCQFFTKHFSIIATFQKFNYLGRILFYSAPLHSGIRRYADEVIFACLNIYPYLSFRLHLLNLKNILSILVRIVLFVSLK